MSKEAMHICRCHTFGCVVHCQAQIFMYDVGGGRVVRRCWVNFQCRGVLLICMIVGQGHTALAVGAGRGCLDIFTLI